MKFNINDAPAIVLEWAKAAVIPKSDKARAFGILVFIKQKRFDIIAKLKAFEDENGMIDTDILAESLEEVGGKVPSPYDAFDWVFDKEDLDIIIEKAKPYAR